VEDEERRHFSVTMLVSFGVAFEVAATMCGTFGKQLVSYSGKVRPAKRARLFKFMGLTATTLFGPVLDALAYALAPQSLVAPLNGLDIVWNACSAPFTLGEPLTRSYALGSVLVFMGSSLSAHFAQHHDREGTLERQREIFFSWRLAVWVLAGVGGLLVSFWVIRRRPRGVGDWQRGLALGGTAGFVAVVPGDGRLERLAAPPALLGLARGRDGGRLERAPDGQGPRGVRRAVHDHALRGLPDRHRVRVGVGGPARDGRHAAGRQAWLLGLHREHRGRGPQGSA